MIAQGHFTSYPCPKTFSISGHKVTAANSPSNGRRRVRAESAVVLASMMALAAGMIQFTASRQMSLTNHRSKLCLTGQGEEPPPHEAALPVETLHQEPPEDVRTTSIAYLP